MFRVICFFFCFVTLGLLQAQNAKKIDAYLSVKAGLEQELDYVVILQHQPDVRPAAGIRGKNNKSAFVYQTLKKMQMTASKHSRPGFRPIKFITNLFLWSMQFA